MRHRRRHRAGSRRRPPCAPRARQLGVDLATVAGSGPGGRILLSDLDGAAAAPVRPSAPPPGPAAGRPVERAPSPASPPPRRGAPAAREPLSLLRKLTSRIMVESVRTIPHVTDCDDADVTDLDRLRRGFNDDPSRDPAHDAPKLGLLPFVVAAVARALRRHPVFNAGLDVEREEIVYHDRIGIAIGVQTERGLVAPVLRDPDRRSIRELAVEIDRITAKCRAGRFESADAEGATYTISNAGAMGGSRYSTPIITPPQVAVLAVGRSRLMPWVVDGRVEPRLVMPLSHSMDHRIVDGAQEIAFMRDVIGDLERPARLLL
ncbi:MAG: 2-oxo acid dehydrogenase subunit E2 [Phycisphaeraceae bacterium]|nr:2-oxo acid dehydrogenase subunit E2 [Phycisphaeraceae bacterium]